MKTSYSSAGPRYKWLNMRFCLIWIAVLIVPACGILTPKTNPAMPAATPETSLPGSIQPTSEALPSEVATQELSEGMSMDAAMEALTARQISSLFGNADAQANPQPLELVEQWFSYDPSSGGITLVFVVKNPNPDWAFSSALYTVTFLDKAGNSVGTPFLEEVGPLFAGQTAAICKSYYVPANTEVAKVDIQPGIMTVNQPGSQSFPLSAEQVRLITYDDHLSVTGVIKNSLDKDISWIQVVAVAYDEAGKLMDGGDGIATPFIPSNGQVAVDIRLETTGTPARVDLIPSFAGYSSLELPSDELVDIQIAGIGVKMGGNNSADYTALFENTSQKVYLALDYRFAFYAEDGSVIAVQASQTGAIFPHETMAALGTLYLPAGARVARADVQFNYQESINEVDPTSFALTLTANPLSAAPEVAITEDDYYYFFTGRISNSLDTLVEGAIVYAVAYDEQGKIMGSSRVYVDVPGKGSAEVKLSLMKPGSKPARVILFPTLPTNWEPD